MAVTRAGLQLVEPLEHLEPSWRPVDVRADAWGGRLPSSSSLLARRP